MAHPGKSLTPFFEDDRSAYNAEADTSGAIQLAVFRYRASKPPFFL